MTSGATGSMGYVQAVRFDTRLWIPLECRAWLTAHSLQSKKTEVANGAYLWEQVPRSIWHSYRTLRIPSGIEFVLGFTD
jgi:hypothetical protein